ncbi:MULTISPECIES: glycosyltransferase [unclassified Lentimonas]|uniref:glycosyltransferase n=1 Tax=unclassified Lentimonas TaxID=2630993 RepID=UPI00132BFE24|nr:MULTISPECIES: glycosyltransferase [unclassified Lentimonas]CAA6685461.1 Unannotated [Lentimonas sp. CC6]CAA7170460.1 Unannotated [Lentimonas sp. CC21]CAA6678369.1 Unannotated [Lentimonas sp. CC4]CAA7076909.1 Unannotated [Lentimonas sp. CC4]CAA7179844.1 Unannotated [Lentimonas sp. CC8]
MRSSRNIAWFVCLCVAGGASLAYAIVTSSFDSAGGFRVLLFTVIGASGLFSIFLFPRFKSSSRAVWAIWLSAIFLRLLLLPTAPSDDVSRYLWEGQLVRAGVSPYEQTANAESVSQYRDVHWEGMNHKDRLTAYPPLSELAFAAIGGAWYQPLSYKVVFVLSDLLTLGGVLLLLKRRGIGVEYSGFYALCPVVLISYAGEAHFDALMLAPLVWALWAYESGRRMLAVALASVATGVKWIALPLIPFFAGKRLVVGGCVAVATLLLPALYFYDTLDSLISGLFTFGGASSFNGLLYDCLLRGVGLPRVVCSGIVVCLFGGVILWRWFWRDRASLDSHLRWILGALIVLSPTVHFWYLSWILPFVCLRPSLPWITFTLTSGVYFFVWTNASWGLLPWQQFVFWGPFVLACAYEAWSTKGRVLWPVVRRGFACEARDDGLDEPLMTRAAQAQPKRIPSTVSVVIPTLNAEQQLPAALASVIEQSVAVDEVIIVDAGSTDATVVIANSASLPVRVLSSERGRGLQIGAGLEAAQGDWVVVLHADAQLSTSAVECLLRAVAVNSDMIGGAMGQRFEDGNPELLPIEVLNDLRAVFSRTAFGDQVQFFHRETALRYQLMPKQPLMEDVESSWRTRECGAFVFLNQPCLVSHQKWNPKKWLTRFRLVMRIVSRYRFARMHGHRAAEALSYELYDEYYSIRK